jgi:hypothetical protein
MSKKKLASIPKSQGGWYEDEPSKRITVKPEIHRTQAVLYRMIKDEPIDLVDIIMPTSKTEDPEYMTVIDYANEIHRPPAVVYRMIKDGSVKSVKINNKLHIILE